MNNCFKKLNISERNKTRKKFLDLCPAAEIAKTEKALAIVKKALLVLCVIMVVVSLVTAFCLGASADNSLFVISTSSCNQILTGSELVVKADSINIDGDFLRAFGNGITGSYQNTLYVIPFFLYDGDLFVANDVQCLTSINSNTARLFNRVVGSSYTIYTLQTISDICLTISESSISQTISYTDNTADSVSSFSFSLFSNINTGASGVSLNSLNLLDCYFYIASSIGAGTNGVHCNYISLMTDTFGYVPGEGIPVTSIASQFLSPYKNDGSAPLLTTNSEWESGNANVSALISDNGNAHNYALRVGSRTTLTVDGTEGPLAPLDSMSFTDVCIITDSLLNFTSGSPLYKIVDLDISDYLKIENGKTYKLQLVDTTTSETLDTTYISASVDIAKGANSKGVTTYNYLQLGGLETDLSDGVYDSCDSVTKSSDTSSTIKTTATANFITAKQSQSDKVFGTLMGVPEWTADGLPLVSLALNDNSLYHDYYLRVSTCAKFDDTLSNYIEYVNEYAKQKNIGNVFENINTRNMGFLEAMSDYLMGGVNYEDISLAVASVANGGVIGGVTGWIAVGIVAAGFVQNAIIDAEYQSYYEHLKGLEMLNSYQFTLNRNITFDGMKFSKDDYPYYSDRVCAINLSDYMTVPKCGVLKLEIVDDVTGRVLDNTYVVSLYDYASGQTYGTKTYSYSDEDSLNADADNQLYTNYVGYSKGEKGTTTVSETASPIYTDVSEVNYSISDIYYDIKSSADNASNFFQACYSLMPADMWVILISGVSLLIIARILGR